ncbi:hypothetical protein BJX99DRAFT_229918 [Aspergillus californicus]
MPHLAIIFRFRVLCLDMTQGTVRSHCFRVHEPVSFRETKLRPKGALSMDHLAPRMRMDPGGSRIPSCYFLFLSR